MVNLPYPPPLAMMGEKSLESAKLGRYSQVRENWWKSSLPWETTAHHQNSIDTEMSLDAEKREVLTQAAAFPKSALQGAGLLVAAVATCKVEEVESGDLTRREGRR